MADLVNSESRGRRKDALGIHSIGEFVLTVPSLAKAEHFYRAFGLTVDNEDNALALRVPGGDHRWGRVVEGDRKFLHHISFHCFQDDLSKFRSRLEGLRIRLLDPPPGFAGGGLWFRDHDGVLLEIRTGPKTSPDEMSKIEPAPHEAGARNAPYRSLAGKMHIRRLSHILRFTTSLDKGIEFYSNALGMRLSDRSGDVAFLHGIHGSDHHLIAFVKSEKPGLHHVSWDLPSLDAVGLGAMMMADQGYSKGWGTGRHVLGSNYFHYVRDPWGSYCEYACGIDYIPASVDWVSMDHPPSEGFYLWGPDVPPDFVVNFEGE